MSEVLRRSALALALVVGSGLASCGFHARQGLGPEVASLGIAVFANDSLEPDLERRRSPEHEELLTR